MESGGHRCVRFQSDYCRYSTIHMTINLLFDRRFFVKGSSEQRLGNSHATSWHVALTEVKGGVIGKASAVLEQKDSTVIPICLSGCFGSRRTICRPGVQIWKRNTLFDQMLFFEILKNPVDKVTFVSIKAVVCPNRLLRKVYLDQEPMVTLVDWKQKFIEAKSILT
jgi:hypothetical protein